MTLLGVGFMAQADDHLLFVTDFQPSPGSTISTDQPEISFVAYLKSDLRQQSLIWVEIMGCGTFTQHPSPSEYPLVEMPISPDLVADSGVTEAWRYTADLAEVGCTLDFPAGFEVVVTISAYSTTTFPPFGLFTANNTVSWTFTIDTTSASPIDFDPPTPLLIESISPSIANEGSTFTILGSGFVEPSQLNRSQGSRAYLMLEDGPTPASTSVESSTELTFTVPNDIPCGQHLVQIRNDGVFLPFANNLIQQSVPIGFEVRCPLKILNPIPPGEDPPPGDDEQPGYEVVDLDLPSTAEVNAQINGSVEISHRGFGDNDEVDMNLYVNGDLEDSRQISVDANSTDSFPLNFSFTEDGNYLVRVEVADDALSTTISVIEQDNGGSGNQLPPSGDLGDLDENGNCTLDDGEFFVAVDAWIAATISDINFFAAVDAWIAQSDICASAAQISTESPFATQLHGNMFHIEATDNNALIESMKADFFDLNGRYLNSAQSSGSRLTWNMRDAMGSRLANGVYIYRVRVVNAKGEVAYGNLHKLIVMR